MLCHCLNQLSTALLLFLFGKLRVSFFEYVLFVIFPFAKGSVMQLLKIASQNKIDFSLHKYLYTFPLHPSAH